MRKTTLLNYLFPLVMFLFLVSPAASQPQMAGGEEDQNIGRLTGVIVDESNKIIAPGFVALFKSEKYEPHDYGSNRRSPEMIAFIREDGRFTAPVAPGSYYLGVIPRKLGKRPGPPKKGEKRLSAFTPDGKYRIFHVRKGETVDLGRVTVREPGQFRELSRFFTVTGRVLDENGKGVASALVMAKVRYEDPKPSFISDPAGPDGSYSLKLPPGKYYFIARQSLTMAGRPDPGSPMGVLGQTKPVGIGGKSDEPPAFIVGRPGDHFDHVDITMFKIPVPEERRREIEAQVQANRIDKSSLPSSLPLKSRGIMR